MESSNNFFGRMRNHVRNGRLSTTFAVLTALTVGILGGSMLTGKVSGHEQKVDSSDARPLVIPDPKILSNGFSAIVKQVGPAVVNINTESIPKPVAVPKRNGRRGQVIPAPDGNGGGDQGDMQDFFNKFFGGQGGGEEDGGGATRYALGSGFIVSANGYIITNNHVVEKADHIYVKLSTDPEGTADHGRPATVIGVDKETDIAVIKIDTAGLKEPLHTVKLGNSDGAQVGDWVLAIGSPFGLSQTVSAGIVSAKNRSIDEPGPGGVAQGQFQKFIQTDAAINPGNSGGPLVDLSGEVIGMNTAIYTQSAGSEGIGFAMPSNTLATVYNMLISPEHKVTRGSIGIQFQPSQNSAVGRMYGFANGGVLISKVTPKGPAEKAGLQSGDVITSVDGASVKDGDALVAIVSAKKPGTAVKLGYERGGKHMTAEVTISDRAKLFVDTDTGGDDSNTPEDSDVGEGKLGITVQPTPANVASKMGVKGGVTITSVRPGSFAEEINLPKGAVISEINRKPVPDEGAYKAIVMGLKSGDDVVFVVNVPGGGGNSYIGGTLP